MFNTSKIIAAATVLATLAVSSVSAATIERAGGAKVVGESSWVSAITVVLDNGDRIKMTTEKDAAGRVLEAGDSFDQLVVAPRGAFSISNPYSVADYVEAQYGEHVEILFTNGEDERDHW